MNINPYLIARLYTIQAAFAQPGYISTAVNSQATSPKQAKPQFNWEDLLQEDDDEGGQGGGGGGTIKGLRGKNDVAGKAAMRRLGRK